MKALRFHLLCGWRLRVAEICLDFHLDLFQFLSGNEIETKITEIKTQKGECVASVKTLFISLKEHLT